MSKKRRSTYEIYARKRKLYKYRPLIILGVVIAAILIAVIVMVVVKLMQSPKEEEASYNELSTSTLPTIYLSYDNHDINLMYGYVDHIDMDYAKRDVYLLEETYEIPIEINTYGTEISEISFRIYNNNTDELIQNSTVTEYSFVGDVIYANVRVDNIIDENTEYILEIDLKDGDGRDIYYYNRIRRDSSTDLSNQLNTALYFNSCIYNASDADAKNYLVSNMETDYFEDDNTDFGHSSLKSSITALTWGDMRVSVCSDISIEILDIDEEIGNYLLNYRITRDNSGVTEYYDVSEYYRLRTTSSGTYVLNYERSVNQVFIPDESIFGTRSVDLGVIEDKDLSMKCNKAGNISCFVVNNTLWEMDTDTKTINKVFSFSNGLDDVRGNYDHHRIEIASVTDEKIEFVVYGYMNAGDHEGQVGVGLFTYDISGKTVTEEMFVPVEAPYEILEESIGDLFYTSDTGLLYMMINQSLYELNLTDKTSRVIAGGLNSENSLVQTSGRWIAWHDGGKINDATRIYILDMETGNQFSVDAASGCCVKILGFLDEEIVYGQGKSGNIYTDDSGNEYLLMTDMYSLNSEGVEQVHYESGEFYYIDSLDEYNRIIIYQIIDNDGVTEPAENFTLFLTDIEDYPSMSTYEEYVETKKNTYHVVFGGTMTTAGEISVEDRGKVIFTPDDQLEIPDAFTIGDRYYVYAKGKIQSTFESPAEAIMSAYELYGSVYESDGKLFYKRGVLPAYVEMSAVTVSNARNAFNEGNSINVTGITLTQALYFIGNKIPFVIEYDGAYYVVKGYDSSNYYTIVSADSGDEAYLYETNLTNAIESGSCFVVQVNY